MDEYHRRRTSRKHLLSDQSLVLFFYVRSTISSFLIHFKNCFYTDVAGILGTEFFSAELRAGLRRNELQNRVTQDVSIEKFNCPGNKLIVFII